MERYLLKLFLVRSVWKISILICYSTSLAFQVQFRNDHFSYQRLFCWFFLFKKIVLLGDMLDLWLQAEWRARVSCFSARFYNLLQWVWIPMESFSGFYIKIEVSRNLNFIFMLAFQSKIITLRLLVCVNKHNFHNFLN